MILDKIVEKKREYLKIIKNEGSLENLKDEISKTDRKIIDFYSALKENKDISIIAEVKKASPSKGLIRAGFQPVEIAKEYLKSDVQAMSVLTEVDFFQGSPEFLKEIRIISDIPLLRKDFIIDEYQVYEAYLLGADAILLIAAILTDMELESFGNLAKSLGMRCLAEVHDEKELGRVLMLDFDIVGINNRNLNTFEEDLSTTERLAEKIPESKVIVSESGIRANKDIEYLKGLGAKAVLIGETFMRSDNIYNAIEKIRGR